MSLSAKSKHAIDSVSSRATSILSAVIAVVLSMAVSLFLGAVIVWPLYNHSVPAFARSFKNGTPMSYWEILCIILLLSVLSALIAGAGTTASKYQSSIHKVAK